MKSSDVEFFTNVDGAFGFDYEGEGTSVLEQLVA
jgi:hypothetical protein